MIKLETIDADASDTLTYALVNGEGSEDNTNFAIDDNTMEATFVFEYREDERFYVRVQVTDSSGNTFLNRSRLRSRKATCA